MKCYIIDYGKAKKVRVNGAGKGKTTVLANSYVVLCEAPNGQTDEKTSMPLYSVAIYDEATLVNKFTSVPDEQRVNFTIVNGRVKGKGASLERFNQAGYRVKPFTVLAEIHLDDGTMLGYLFSTNNGYTYMRKRNDFIQDCEKLIKQAESTATEQAKGPFKPVQNMKFIQPENGKTETAYLSIYDEGHPLPVVILAARKNKFASQSAEPEKKSQTAKGKLESIYTPEQIAELKKAKTAGVDLRIISDNRLTPKQMNIIWVLESKGKPGRKFANPEYSEEHMVYLGMMLNLGVNIDPILNPLYTNEQSTEILRGVQLGLDINLYADPGYDADTMNRMRHDLEDGMWGTVYAEKLPKPKKLRIMSQLDQKKVQAAAARREVAATTMSDTIYLK